MNISAISMTQRTPQVFRGKTEEKPVDLSKKNDSEVVTVGTWGPNYAFKVTVGDLKKLQALNAILEANVGATQPEESMEEYQDRKINSVEWML